MILYADTSGLAKLFLDEPGTQAMAGAIGEAEVTATAAIAYVELRSAMARAIREGRIPADHAREQREALDRFWSRVSEIPVELRLIRAAGDLAEQMHLRAYDAVHLGALRRLGEPDQVTFACWDGELREAARQLGYALIPA